MPRINLSSVFAHESARLVRMGRNGDRVVERAMGTLKRRLPVEARRDMQDEYSLPAARISAGLSTRTEPEALVLIGAKRGIGLIEFSGKWGGVRTTGASARVRKGAASEIYDGTFIAAGRSGNRQIFERRGKTRLPLRTLYGPSVADMLKNEARRERLVTFAQTILAAELARLLKD